MSRAFLVVMDSVGIGGAPDAGRFFNGTLPDTGANTLGHVAQWCRAERGRALDLPVLAGLGLGRALEAASGQREERLLAPPLTGRWGVATETSSGKDTPSGHWELAGLPVLRAWHVFPDTVPAFPDDLVAAVAEAAGTAGILGNCHASGTEIIERLGPEHVRTGWPICYTSADSVFQIAAHEESFGLDRLLALCEALAPRLHAMRVGRVIARPFTGGPGAYRRTLNRRDYASPPPGPILTTAVQQAGGPVHAVGKIGDIFSMTGIDTVHKGSDAALMGHLGDLVGTARQGALVFANFVEFDSLYGHRRDPGGYSAHLEWFDSGLGRLLPRLGAGDMLLVTADHGNDPTWPGTDHTRERVPVLIAGQGGGALGHMGFVDVARLVATHLGVVLPDPPDRDGDTLSQ